MRLFEIAGNSEEDVFISMQRIMVMLKSCSIAYPSKNRDIFIERYMQELHIDKQNLLNWVTRSKRIADVYYKIPEQYRK